MAYRSLPKFDPSARYLATARLGAFNGVRIPEGEPMPSVPVHAGEAVAYRRRLRQLYEARKIAVAPKTKKEKANGRAKLS